jgi:DNA-binding NtrC family response regulator
MILPIPPTPKATAPRVPQFPPNPRQRILVVEGAADLRQLNSEVLVCSGYHVDTAADGEAAWAALRQNRYDLLITAQHLPKLSGVDLISKMHDTSLRLPTIMTTKILPTWEFASRPWLQPTTMVKMPYTTDDFLWTVKNVLRAHTSDGARIAPQPNLLDQSSVVGLQL